MRKQGEVGLVEDNDMPFDDPYKNLAYRTILRAMMDAVGKELNLNSDERSRNQRIPVINQAREWIHEDSKDPLSFETLCHGLNIEPDVLRRRIPKAIIRTEKQYCDKKGINEKRNMQIVRYMEQGHVLEEASRKFGMSKRWVSKIKNSYYYNQIDLQGV
jgi:AraC-like DNA-binding protein